MAVFRQKDLKKVCYKVSLCEYSTVSDKVVRHSLVYQTVQKWLVVEVPFYDKIWPKVTHPFNNADFQSIFARSVSAVTPWGKVQLTQIVSPLWAFQ